MKQPLVSVLVPIYKVERFIERCAHSLFEQTFENIEYIFVNDCTPDNSIIILEKIIEEYPTRKDSIKIIHHQQNKGIAEVRNSLLAQASGVYTLFIDSDDWIEKDTVRLLYNKAKEEDADIVGCDFFIDNQDERKSVHETNSIHPFTQLKLIIGLQVKAYLWKLLVRRTLYTQNNIRFLPEIHIGEDDIVCVKLYYYASKIAFLPIPLYHYIQYNPERYTNISQRNIEQFLEAAQHIKQFCIQKNILPQIEKELHGRIFITKNRFLTDKRFEDFYKWRNTSPEVNYAWRQYHFPIGHRFIFWLAEHNAFACIRLIKSLKQLFK